MTILANEIIIGGPIGQGWPDRASQGSLAGPIGPARYLLLARAYLEGKGIAENRIITWPAQSPDLNPIENLCTTYQKTSVSC